MDRPDRATPREGVLERSGAPDRPAVPGQCRSSAGAVQERTSPGFLLAADVVAWLEGPQGRPAARARKRRVIANGSQFRLGRRGTGESAVPPVPATACAAEASLSPVGAPKRPISLTNPDWRCTVCNRLQQIPCRRSGARMRQATRVRHWVQGVASAPCVDEGGRLLSSPVQDGFTRRFGLIPQ